MTQWGNDIRAAVAVGEAEAAQKDVEIKAAHDEIARLQEELSKPTPVPDPVPTPQPPSSDGVQLGYAGDDPNGKAKALRVYLNPGDAFPKPKAGVLHVVTYKGTDHANRVAQAKSYARPLLFGWTHEPENGTNNISAATYKAGWAVLNTELAKQKVTNVKRIWCLMSISFDSVTAANYYPGDSVVDVVAADGYDWCGCKTNRYAAAGGKHRNMATIFDKVVRFAQLHSKEVAFLEFGTPAEKSGDEKGRALWVTDSAKYCKSRPQGVNVVAATYFNHDAGFKCVWALKGASQAAWEAAF